MAINATSGRDTTEIAAELREDLMEAQHSAHLSAMLVILERVSEGESRSTNARVQRSAGMKNWVSISSVKNEKTERGEQQKKRGRPPTGNLKFEVLTTDGKRKWVGGKEIEANLMISILELLLPEGEE